MRPRHEPLPFFYTSVRPSDQCLERRRAEAPGARGPDHGGRRGRGLPAQSQDPRGAGPGGLPVLVGGDRGTARRGTFDRAGFQWGEPDAGGARLKPGDRLGIGETVRLEMVSYTAPCQNNAAWFKDGNFTRISHKRYPGWSRLYARVLTEGIVKQGHEVQVEVKVKTEGEGK